MVWQMIFWICVFFLAHTYVFYPVLLRLLTGKRSLQKHAIPEAELPKVSMLLSVYNEEAIIEKKLRSVCDTTYPLDKLELLVGSDGSTDATDSIIQKLIVEGLPIRFTNFGGRNGKSNILNALAPQATGEILLLTDANILFDRQTIPHLVRHFTDPQIGLVSANILNSGMRKDGISFQEQAYIQRENLMKYREGVIWGATMGAFGACYAVRNKLFIAIPRNFLMEDFYITMHVIREKYAAICDLDAHAYEDVSNLVHEEFKRKIRISAGNFQNLGVFYPMLGNMFSGKGFAFLSHKVLRWLGPFFLIIALISSAIAGMQNLFYCVLFFVQLAGMLSPLIDKVLAKVNMHNFVLRLIAYFYLMNLALFLGFIKYAGGIRTNAWSPTKRNLEN